MPRGQTLLGIERIERGNGSFEFAVVQLVEGETPAGLINGVNTIFTLAGTPALGTVSVFSGRLRQVQGVDYTLSADEKTITTTVPPVAGTLLRIQYYKR